MGARFRKSKNLGHGVKLNVSKSSVGVSMGTKGARVSVNSSGRITKTVGIPGTGVYYSHSESTGSNFSFSESYLQRIHSKFRTYHALSIVSLIIAVIASPVTLSAAILAFPHGLIMMVPTAFLYILFFVLHRKWKQYRDIFPKE